MTRAELANLTRAFSSTHNLTPKLLTAIIDEYCKKKNKTASVTAEVRSSVPCIAILLNRAVHMNQEKLVERLFRIFKAASTRKYKHTTLLAILHAMTLIKDAELGERVVLRITDILEGPFTLRESSYLFAKLSIVMPGHAVQLRLLDVIRKKLAIPQRVKPLLIEMFLEKKGVQGIAEWRFGPKGGAPPPTPIAPRTPDVPDPTALLEDALQKHSAHDIADLTVLAEGLQNGTTGFDRKDMADVVEYLLVSCFAISLAETLPSETLEKVLKISATCAKLGFRLPPLLFQLVEIVKSGRDVSIECLKVLSLSDTPVIELFEPLCEELEVKGGSEASVVLHVLLHLQRLERKGVCVAGCVAKVTAALRASLPRIVPRIGAELQGNSLNANASFLLLASKVAQRCTDPTTSDLCTQLAEAVGKRVAKDEGRSSRNAYLQPAFVENVCKALQKHGIDNSLWLKRRSPQTELQWVAKQSKEDDFRDVQRTLKERRTLQEVMVRGV